MLNQREDTADRSLMTILYHLHLPALLLAVVALAGCAGQYVTVKNQSNTDLTVRLYVGDRDDPAAQPGGLVPLYHTERHMARLKVGGSTTFHLRKNKFYKKEARDPVIRLWFQSRAPAFASGPVGDREHWIELVSFPPATIVVDGSRDKLHYAATQGEISFVPRELWLAHPDPYSTRQVNADE